METLIKSLTYSPSLTKAMDQFYASPWWLIVLLLSPIAAFMAVGLWQTYAAIQYRERLARKTGEGLKAEKHQSIYH